MRKDMQTQAHKNTDTDTDTNTRLDMPRYRTSTTDATSGVVDASAVAASLNCASFGSSLHKKSMRGSVSKRQHATPHHHAGHDHDAAIVEGQNSVRGWGGEKHCSAHQASSDAMMGSSNMPFRFSPICDVVFLLVMSSHR
jgi:hypothetical protein